MIIKKIMDKSPLTVREGDFLTHARQVIRDNDLKAIPVLNEKNKVEGILTRRGVLNITSNKSNVEVKGFIKQTPLVTSDTSVREAGKEMIKANSGVLPVISSKRDPRLKGVVKLIDIFASLKKLNVQSNQSIGDIMSEKVETIGYDTPVQKCWRKVLETGYSGFPVIKNESIIGIITRGDILEAGYARVKGDDDSQSSGKNSPPVERVMTTPVKKVFKDTSVKEARDILLKKEIGRLPVVSKEDEKKLIGIVDRYDILNSYLR